VEILKRFQMLDCKPLATHMVSNLKLDVDLGLDLADPSIISRGLVPLCIW
jgi:hypothetical protein